MVGVQHHPLGGKRFPCDFMFEQSRTEAGHLRSQIATSSVWVDDARRGMRSPSMKRSCWRVIHCADATLGLDCVAGAAYHRGMSHRAPPWLPHSHDDPERARYAAMSVDDRLACFVEVCNLAQTIIDARPDRSQVLRGVDPMTPVAEKTWRDLIRRARDAGYSW